MECYTQKKIVKATTLKKGYIIVIVDRPYKIVEITKCKTGKHGSCKIHIVGIDIFTNKKIQAIFTSSENIETTEVIRKEYELVDISNDNFATFILEKGNIKSDLKIPSNDIGDDIRRNFNQGNIVWITILSSLSIEEIISFKIEKNEIS